jgi:hypothetical protein
MRTIDLDALRDVFGFGVAGNFAGHLEQAGEAVDFVAVSAEPEAPKGIFPWYVPGDAGFLGTFPLSTDAIVLPASDTPLNLQIEPEVGVLATVRDGALSPVALGAFNDCSIRRPGAKKISHKKNWGPASKGVAPTFFAIDDLAEDGPTAGFRLACFLRRDGVTSAYGVDSPLPDYSYYGQRLLDWIADRLRAQQGADDTPLEDVGGLLEASGASTVLVGIGATRYTDVGATTFLQPGDESLVVVYDGAASTPDDVEAAVAAGREDALPAASVLRQTVRSTG